MKIFIDHYAEFTKEKLFAFFINKKHLKKRENHKNIEKLEYRPLLTFTIGQIVFESIFKHLAKTGIHENTIEKTKKLRASNGIFNDETDFLKFCL